jgi:hypothetical protein
MGANRTTPTDRSGRRAPGSGGAGAGNIAVNASINKTAGGPGGLLLIADGSITLGPGIAIGSSSNSNAFGSFLAGKIYLVDVLIYATNLDSNSYPLKIAFTSSSGSPTISASYLVINGSSYRTTSLRPEYSIIAKVLVNASAVEATSSLIATVTCGAQTGGTTQKLTVSGDFFYQEIGAIN